MGYQFLTHTADVRIQVTAETLKELFTDAFHGLMKFQKLNAEVTKNTTTKHLIEIESPDRTALLIDFMNEVLYLSHTHKEYYSQIHITELTGTRITAQIAGIKVKEFDEDIKAITYHEANIEQTSTGKWKVTIIFDI